MQGLGLLSMSTPPVFGPCSEYKEECIGHKQKVLFYISLLLIAAGMAGHLVSIGPLLSQQSESENEKEKGNENDNGNGNGNEQNSGAETEEIDIKFMQVPGFFMVIVVLITGGIGLPYIKPWSLRFGIPTICSVVATLWFFTGFREYKHTEPNGSPLTTTLRVFVATARNISQPIPNREELSNEEDARSTTSLRFLDKAAINLPGEQEQIKWKVCSVREVEDTKIGIRMLPVWLTFIVIGIVLSIGNTYFLEQANHMDRKLGKIKVPIPIFLLFYKATSSVSAKFYSFLTVICKKKYAPPIGIATGMVFSVLCCITAAKVETRRLHRIRDHGLIEKPDERIPMSIFALLPQFMLLAAVDGITNTSISGFFRHQTPESMHKYLEYFTKGVLGLGTMASVLSVYVVGKVSERNHKPNWFQYTLNKSRLDRYYLVLAGLSTVNLFIYVFVAYFYKYKESPDGVDDEPEGGEMDEGFEDKKCCC
ncbi:putative proton-dependent oligopeptide transporter family, MFS transporter superfamily [Helianthus anomalus]